MTDTKLMTGRQKATPPPKQRACMHAPKSGEANVSVPELAMHKDILSQFSEDLEGLGVVGEDRIARLIYLVLSSRFLDRPVSLAVKGPSSGGKSFVTQQALRFFPEDAYVAYTSMSDRALVYSEEELKHRHLVLFEADGMKSDFFSYIIRSLLSEGRISYETVESGPKGLLPRKIEKEGPTGLLVTTTAASLHPENETRMLSVTVQDTKEQTRAILIATAKPSNKFISLDRWLEFQDWLSKQSMDVVVPYAERLADLCNPVATRFRRDFKSLINLIRTHAIIHQQSRARNTDGSIVAEQKDYATVYELVGDIISEGMQATVPSTVRDTVNAVADMLNVDEQPVQELMDNPYGREGVTVKEVADVLDLDASTAQRRVQVALKLRYLVNNETFRYRPYKLVLGDPLPEEVEVLPHPSKL